MTSEIGTLRSEMATKSDIETIRSGTATMEQRMTSEIGTLTTRSELDVLMSRQKQEILEQMQQRRDEETTTLNETVNHMNIKLEDKIKVVDCQLSQVKLSVSTHSISMETIKTTLDVQMKQSSDQKQKFESQMNETKTQTANRKESVKQETQGLLDKAPSLEGLLRMMSVFEQYLKGNDNRTQTIESKVLT